jgi:hypothetical protein
MEPNSATTVKAPKDYTAAVFGFALIAVGLAIFLMGPQKLAEVFDHGVSSAPVAVLLLFGLGGVGFVISSLLYNRRRTTAINSTLEG